MAMSTIVFDLGGVVCRYKPELRLQELAQIYGRTPEDIHRVLYKSGFIGETELGYWSAEQISSEIAARLGRRADRAELERAWLASFQVDEEVLKLVGRTAVRHRTAVLTNNDLLLREALLRIHPELSEHFDDIVFSAEIHAAKPAAESYRRAVSVMMAEPSKVLFVDDSAPNVAGALHAGISAVLFRNARQLATELEERGHLDS